MKNQKKMPGTLDVGYAYDRNTRKAIKYRLKRRTVEVVSAIDKYSSVSTGIKIIDLGAADGRMLNCVNETFAGSQCAAVEYNRALVAYASNQFPVLDVVQGDIQSLSFISDCFDFAIATAVIEHVASPRIFLEEIKRILKPDGILVLTSPDPRWEKIATLVGHLEEEDHNEVMNLKQLNSIISVSGFTILDSYKFMLSPVGLPFEKVVEKWIRKFKLDWLMANQLVIARRT